MKAAYIREPGPPQAIVFGELDPPTLGPQDVLVRTTAVAVNPIDTYIRGGANFWPLPEPFIVGCDLAGVVEAVGSSVERWQLGDRVWGSNQGLLGRQGTFAEYCAVDEELLYPVPSDVSDQAAVACALGGITAHLGLFREARLAAGETVFVQGGSGGVGSMVVQMAKAAGAHVIATAGSEQKMAKCLDLGADHVIHHGRQDVLQSLQELAPQGVDVAWETQREANLDLLVTALAERGRLILMAGRDARPPLPVGPFYVKECSIHGFVMFKASAAEQQVCASQINSWLAAGQLQPCIGRQLPLSAAAEAHRLQEASTVQRDGSLMGKIVLTP